MMKIFEILSFPALPNWPKYYADLAKQKEMDLREKLLEKSIDKGLSGEEALVDADKQYDLIQELRERHARS